MTATSNTIKKLISYSWTDINVSTSEQNMVISSLKSDPDINRTIIDLNSAGMLQPLVFRVDSISLKNSLVQILGGRLSTSTAALLVPYISRITFNNYLIPYFTWIEMFKICNSCINYFKSKGMVFSPGTAPNPAIVGPTSTSPYSGSGATGVNPTKRNIPAFDKIKLLAKNAATRQQYMNPVGSLTGYLATLSHAQKIAQASNLVKQPVSTIFPDAYASKPPSRAAIMKLAAKIYRVEPELIAGFILAEQRDQSSNEDAADYQGAVSIKSANTSIGLGQIVVSTAQKDELFSDLLPSKLSKNLKHDQAAMLLASDEFNIFGVAKYLRMVADDAAKISATNLAKTKAVYPGLDIGKYAMNSSVWPPDNIKALGSEYTSRAWDGRIFPYWGNFVYTAYTNIKAAGIP